MGWVKLFLLLLFSVGILWSVVFLHEATHSEIAKLYGCDNIELSFVPSDGSIASMTADCSSLSSEEYHMYLSSQANVENTTYNLGVWLVLIFLVLLWRGSL